MNNLLKNAVYGFIIGDVMGVPYEFLERGSFKCTGISSGGISEVEEGTWSDDSSMMLATCSSIKKCGAIDIDDITKNFLLWLSVGKFTQNGKAFGVGKTTYRALTTGMGLNDERSNGNGSLMRILPLIFTDASDSVIEEVSSITHAHKISCDACKIYVSIGRRIVKGENIKDILSNLKLDAPFNRLSEIYKLNESMIKSTGYVVDTIEAVCYVLVTTSSFKEAILKAVNLGGDTDTIAALVGGLAGIMYGIDSIPEEWLSKVYRLEVAEECLF
ncbi:MAG: ADP-ribosylglycohydrolase family protein [Bacilli bacterium]|nr:ADP-ribosylglycohydrolase family protein [Bacilli bacterium]